MVENLEFVVCIIIMVAYGLIVLDMYNHSKEIEKEEGENNGK